MRRQCRERNRTKKMYVKHQGIRTVEQAAEPCEGKVEQSTDILEKYRRGSRKLENIYFFLDETTHNERQMTKGITSIWQTNKRSESISMFSSKTGGTLHTHTKNEQM